MFKRFVQCESKGVTRFNPYGFLLSLIFRFRQAEKRRAPVILTIIKGDVETSINAM